MSLRQQKFSFLSHRLINLVKALYENLLPECTICVFLSVILQNFFGGTPPDLPRLVVPLGTSPKVGLRRHTIVTKL